MGVGVLGIAEGDGLDDGIGDIQLLEESSAEKDDEVTTDKKLTTGAELGIGVELII